jgi:hypothetical protein
MRFFLALLLIATVGFLAGLLLDWWSIAIVAFLVALLIPQNLLRSFLSGFLGIFVLWATLTLWIDTNNSGKLSHQVAELFKLGGSSLLLVFITALLGGVVGGFASMAGGSLRPVKVRR